MASFAVSRGDTGRGNQGSSGQGYKRGSVNRWITDCKGNAVPNPLLARHALVPNPTVWDAIKRHCWLLLCSGAADGKKGLVIIFFHNLFCGQRDPGGETPGVQLDRNAVGSAH